MVKLIALDMDGTLLGPNHDISRRNMEAINKAMERGVQVVVATGRAFYEAHGIIRLRAAGIIRKFKDKGLYERGAVSSSSAGNIELTHENAQKGYCIAEIREMTPAKKWSTPRLPAL